MSGELLAHEFPHWNSGRQCTITIGPNEEEIWLTTNTYTDQLPSAEHEYKYTLQSPWKKYKIVREPKDEPIVKNLDQLDDGGPLGIKLNEYTIQLSLLGLRNLPRALTEPELNVTSFWEHDAQHDTGLVLRYGMRVLVQKFADAKTVTGEEELEKKEDSWMDSWVESWSSWIEPSGTAKRGFTRIDTHISDSSREESEEEATAGVESDALLSRATGERATEDPEPDPPKWYGGVVTDKTNNDGNLLIQLDRGEQYTKNELLRVIPNVRIDSRSRVLVQLKKGQPWQSALITEARKGEPGVTPALEGSLAVLVQDQERRQLFLFGDDEVWISNGEIQKGGGIHDVYIERAETPACITLKGEEIDPALLPNPTFRELKREYHALPPDQTVLPSTNSVQAKEVMEKCKGLMVLEAPSITPRDLGTTDTALAKKSFAKTKTKGFNKTASRLGTMMMSTRETRDLKSGLPKVYFDEFTGIAVRLPRYSAPVLRYLQPLGGPAREPEGEEPVTDEIVLMPDVTFALVDRKTGVDYGSTSLSLQEYRHEASEARAENWFKHVSERRTNLEVNKRELTHYRPKGLGTETIVEKPVSTIQHCTVRGQSYKLALDVFAPRRGQVKFTEAMRLGSTLTSQWLCTLRDKNKKSKSSGVKFWSNAEDNDDVEELEDDYLDTATDMWARMGLKMPFEEEVGQIFLNAGDWQLHPQIREEDEAFQCQPRLAVQATDPLYLDKNTGKHIWWVNPGRNVSGIWSAGRYVYSDGTEADRAVVKDFEGSVVIWDRKDHVKSKSVFDTSSTDLHDSRVVTVDSRKSGKNPDCIFVN
jgi:hypothetical protein